MGTFTHDLEVLEHMLGSIAAQKMNGTMREDDFRMWQERLLSEQTEVISEYERLTAML